MSVEMTIRGPVFDGRAEIITRDYADEIARVVAHEGEGVVRAELAKVLQHPTGRYSRSINVVHYGSMYDINDGKMIYGPWLAGVSSLNKKTRFKGYAHWRRSTQRLERRVDSVAVGAWARYRGRLEG
jgi:hypothetical protein